MWPHVSQASSAKKPFYVAAESYKMARLFPLNQSDLPVGLAPTVRIDPEKVVPPGCTVEMHTSDYTPPNFITLLFTDLGVLTPSAVSDELIKLYS